MPRRATLTIVFVTDREAVRADFRGGRRSDPVGLWRRERPAEASLSTAAELAISSGPKVGRRVLILATSLWTQTVTVPTRTVDGLSDGELAQTLKFEVESFSGIPAFDSQLAYQFVRQDDEERQYWVSQLENNRFAALQEMVASRGGKLIGICHPAGLPVMLGGQAAGKRLELWPETVCCIELATQRRLFVSNSDPQSQRWRAEFDAWNSQALSSPVTERLIGSSVTADLSAEPDALRLEETEACGQWLSAWAQQLFEGCQVPMLRPARKPVSKQARVVMAATAATLAAALCLAHLGYLKSSERTLGQRIVELKRPAEQKRKLEDQVEAAEGERQSLQTQLDAVLEDRRTVASMLAWRDRLAILLDRVARCCSDDMMITRLSADGHGLTLEGTSLTADAATTFASRLRPDLLEQGWRVEPPTQEGDTSWVNGGPWNFRVVLREVEPAAESQRSQQIFASSADRSGDEHPPSEPAL